MARIIVTGTTAVLKSEYDLQTLKRVEKYKPETLILRDSNGEPTFRVATRDYGGGSANHNGVCFADSSVTDNKAVISYNVASDGEAAEDIKAAIKDKLGIAVQNLSKIEERIESALASIEKDNAEIDTFIQYV